MKNTKQYSTDVVIVGGGIAGLYAAKKCLANGMSVLILEKAGHLGGRIHTIYRPDGYHIEAGAGRFNAKHTIMRSLIREYGLTELPIKTRTQYVSTKFKYDGKPVTTSSPSHSLLQRVLTESKKWAPQELMKMSLKTFCDRVIGKVHSAILVNSFGYNGEFEKANAHTCLEMLRRDFMNSSYMICKEGLSELVRRMEVSIMPHTTIYKNTEVTGVESKSSYCIVHAKDGAGNARRYIGRIVICAIPQNELKSFTQFTREQQALLNSVASISLNRVYGQFPTPWFKKVPRTTTDDRIRQFIPVNPAQGVAMVTYSDTRYADYWKRQADKGSDHLKKEVLKHLNAVFPDVTSIPSPNWVESYYWPAGVHLWRPGVDANKVIPQIQTIMGTAARVYVVGEAYCKFQGWIEGALESVEDIMSYVIPK
jgi:monoamine oxidase